jgi:hypothetical protein
MEKEKDARSGGGYEVEIFKDPLPTRSRSRLRILALTPKTRASRLMRWQREHRSGQQLVVKAVVYEKQVLVVSTEIDGEIARENILCYIRAGSSSPQMVIGLPLLTAQALGPQRSG